MKLQDMCAIVLFASSALVACNKQSEIAPEPGPGGTGAVDAASEGTPAKSECPKGLAGAALVRLPGDNGTFYCIDEREVLNSEYKAFLTEMAGKLPDQPPECKWNDRLDPDLWEEGSGGTPNGCFAVDFKIDSEPDAAVNCVDFCDAFAYCRWAGKRLCGQQGKPGGAVNVVSSYDELKPRALSSQSEWFSACSQGGKTLYPYGDSYESARCVDLAKVAAQGASALNVKDVEADTCAGTAAPYDAVHHLSGNVAEWTNLCADDGWSCEVRGGSRDAPPSELSCNSRGVASSVTNNAFIGFRCCADAVAP